MKIIKLVSIGVVSLSLLPLAPANAGWQHEWGSAYLDWSGASLSQQSSMSQTIQPLQIANQTYWSMSWVWNQKRVGGYAGIQTQGILANGRVSDLAIFSIWDATNAIPGPESGCLPFGGEGIGYSCRVPIPMVANNRYEITISSDIEKGTKWWKATITLLDSNVSKLIGSIEAPFPDLVASNWGNFIEYWGPKLECNKVKPASAKFSAPKSSNPEVEIHSPIFSMPSRPCVIAAGDTPPKGYIGDAVIRFGGETQPPSTTSMPYFKTKAQIERERIEQAAKNEAASKPITRPTTKKKSVVCVKGNNKLKVTGKKPVCPAGYKRK